MKKIQILSLLLSFIYCNHLFANDKPVEADITGVVNPNGIFLNQFAGSITGSEWFQTMPIEGTDRYQMVDIFGGGFNATITAGGIITLDNGEGGGSFSDHDNFMIFPDLGAIFTFTCNRAPLTNANFPLVLDSPRAANDLFAGTWDNIIESVNPKTGVVSAPAAEVLTLTTSENTLRIISPGGFFFQGVFENGRQIVFRKIVPEPPDTNLSSFPGSDINFSENLIASVYFDDINQFTGLFLLQTRTPLGSQDQSMFRFTATRRIPLAQGDVNGDGVVNIIDRDLLVDQQGNSVESDDYNLSADLNLDDIIDNNDLIIFDTSDEIFINGFE